jgi:DNA polymerase III sliding clamp (beta) subunit (PCNA family)
MNPITLPMAELKPALAGLGKVINKRTTLPVLGCVRIERTKHGTLELAGTDLDAAAVTTLPTLTQGEPVTWLIPFEDLQNVTKSCGREDSLIIALVEKQRAAIRFPVGNQILEHRCESLPVEEFPPIAEIRGEPVTLGEPLRRAIHDALDCASTDPTRVILNGAYLDTSKSDAHYVVGTDGRHLFSSNSFALPLKKSIVIPSHRFLGWKDFNGDGDWFLRVAKPEKDAAPQFELASKHWRFIARSFEGNYPNWRTIQLAPGSAQTTVEIDPACVEEITKAITRLPNYDVINFAIGIEIKDRHIRLLSRSSGDDQWSLLEFDGVKPLGRDVTVYLNRHLMTKALRFGLSRLEIVDAMTPVRFSAGGRQMIITILRPDAARQSKATTPPTGPAPAAAQPEPSAPNPPPSAEQPKEKPMPDTNGTPDAAKRAATNAPDTTEKPALEIALAQLEVVRGDFRNAIAGLNKLGDLLKQVQRENKASEKEISSVRQTLRSLQTVRI